MGFGSFADVLRFCCAGILAICGSDLDLSEVCSQLMFIKVQLPGGGAAAAAAQHFEAPGKDPQPESEPESSTL